MAHPAVGYLKKFAPLASQLSDASGIPTEVILTQGAVESQWGKVTPGNNYFGIKSGKKYKRYASPTDSFRDYVSIMSQDPRYAQALQSGSSEAFLQRVAMAGYSARGWKPYYDFARQILGSVRRYSSVAGVSSLVPQA